MSESKKLYKPYRESLLCFLAVSLVFWVVIRLVSAADFDSSYTRNIKKAVKATTVEEARGI
jgi:membrane-anchored glycerophosphoryl diester phosphodiesterase (GDPDase)